MNSAKRRLMLHLPDWLAGTGMVLQATLREYAYLVSVSTPDEPSQAATPFTLSRPTVQFAFACENISTDPLGRTTFVTLVDQMAAASYPTTTPQLFIVFGFIGQLPGFLLKPRILIEDEQKSRVTEATLRDMPVTADAPLVRAIVGMQGLQWPHAGKYVVKFVANGENVLASFPLTLLQALIPGFPGGPPGAPS